MRPGEGTTGAIAAAVCLLTASCTHRATRDMELADAAMIREDYEAAIGHFDEAIRRDPQLSRAYYGRGAAQHHLEKYEEAIVSYTKAMRLDPDESGPVRDRGMSYWELGAAKKAIRDLERAIEINPVDEHALNNLAWVLSTAPDDDVRDGKQAVELATTACELTDWDSSYPLSTLAAAYAEVGNFEQALKWHRQAIALPDFPADKLDRARERLALYEQGKPYREKLGE